MNKINLNSAAFLVLGVFLLLTPALSQAIITSLVTAFFRDIDLLLWVNLAQNFWILNLIPKVVGATLVAGFVWKHLKTRFKVDLPKIKVQTTRLATYSLLFMLCAGLFLFADVPVSEAATTATTGYILDTPVSEHAWLIGAYSDGTYYAINGGTWDNMVAGVGSTAWATYKTNSTALTAQVLAACTSGAIYMKDVAFDMNLFDDIPEGVRVICSYNAEYWEYINSADSSGSPYTVSVGSGVNVGYYLAQDRQGRICWSSTNGATVTQAVHDAMSTDGGTVNVKGRINIPSTLTFSKPIVWVGDGSGLIWNGFDVHASAFVWTGTTNNVPMIKLLGTLAQSPEKDVAQKFENIAFLYDSSSTGTDAIYLDGENSCVRHIIFDAVNIIGFTGSGVHAKGSVFDIQNNNIGIFGCDLDAYKIEEGPGIPSQFYFFGCMLQSEKTGTYALYSEASRTVVSGGTITCAEAGSNGAYLRKSGALYGVNVEGTAKADSIGVTYIGTGLEITGCSIISWATGLKIGIATSAWASNWYVDAAFGSNTVTDVEITKGGNRRGVLGYTSDKTVSSITNTRLSDDGVPDLLRLKQTQQSPIAIVVGASAYAYKNRDDCMEDVIVSGGNVTLIEWADFLGNYYDLGQTSGAFTLAPGECLRVTYTDAPTMVKVYR